MKILTLLSVLTIFSSSVFAVDANRAADLKAISALTGAKKYAEARAAYQALAAKETGEPAKSDLLSNAAVSLAYSGNVAGAMAELKALNCEQAKRHWVFVGAELASMTSSQLESVYSSIVKKGTASVTMTRLYMKEKQYVKAKSTVRLIAAEAPKLLTFVLSDVTKNSMVIFASKEDQVAFYADLLRVIPAVEENAKVLGIIKSQLELLK